MTVFSVFKVLPCLVGVGLNRGSGKLDLFINRSGQISDAKLF